MIVNMLCIFVSTFSLINAHHKFRCGQYNACYSISEVCIKGECELICVDDESCQEGFICDSKNKVRIIENLLIF